MYALDIICSNGHRFEAWFANRASFEKQRDEGLISCAVCSDTHIQQAISAPRIRKHVDSPASTATPEPKGVAQEPAQKPAVHKAFARFIEKHFEDVGKRFADEALKIHIGDAKGRGIRGTATADEEKELSAEGIPFFKLPDYQ